MSDTYLDEILGHDQTSEPSPIQQPSYNPMLEEVIRGTEKRLQGLEEETVGTDDPLLDAVVSETHAKYDDPLYKPSVEQLGTMTEGDALTFAGELGVKDTYRGIKQIFDLDNSYEEARQAKLNKIFTNPEYGNKALAAYVGGAILDPITWVIPFGKAVQGAKIAKVAATAGLSGAAAGALSYVDPESGFDRLDQTAIGGVGGAVLAPVILGAGKAARPMLAGVKDTYSKYVGEPLSDFVLRKSPGESTTALASGVTGYEMTDEDMPIMERLGVATTAMLAGFAGAKGIAKIPLGGDTTVGKVLAKGIIDNHGLPQDFVTLKKEASAFQNSLVEPFLNVSERISKLSPELRTTLYRVLDGQEGDVSELKGLDKEARETIKEAGQMMVDYGLLNADVFKKNGDSYIHRTYLSKIGKKTEQLTKNVDDFRIIGNELKPRGFIKDFNAKDAKALQAEGWEVVGKPRAGKIKMRMQLNKEQRVLLGEIEDAGYAVAKTGMAMTGDLARFRLFDDVTKKFASDVEFAGSVLVPKTRVGNTSVNVYGNLAGKHVSKEIFDDLVRMEKYRKFANSKDAVGLTINGYRKLNRVWKASKTAWNPVVHTNNIMSNFVLYDLAGGDFENIPKAFKQMTQHASGKDSSIVKLALEHGVFEADHLTKELGQTMSKQLGGYANAAAAGNNPLGIAMKIANWAKKNSIGRLEHLYQAEDRMFRLAKFMTDIDNGIDPAVAARDARKWFIDYDINAPLINALRETATPFLSYSYRILPLLAESATLRPWKFAKWAGLGYAMNHMGGLQPSGDEDFERALLPVDKQQNVFNMPFLPPRMIRMPFTIEGTSQYLDITRWIPGGDIFEAGRGGAGSVEVLPGALQPSFGLAGDLYQGAIGFDPFTGKTVEGLGESKESDVLIKAKDITRRLTPNNPIVPGSPSFNKVRRAITGSDNPFVDNLNIYQAVAQSVGIKLIPADIPLMATRKQFEYKRRFDAVTAMGKRAGKDLMDRAIGQEEYVKRMTEVHNKIAKIKKDMLKLKPKKSKE